MAGQEQQRYETAKRVTIVNTAMDVTLGFLKIIVGYLAHSHALLADGIHSFSDLIGDSLILIAAKMGGKMPDKDHPYGHKRIETLAAMVIAIILLMVGGSIIYNTYQHIQQETLATIYSAPVIIAALISIAVKEWLYRYTLTKGKIIHSNLLITNAYHNRSDVWVSALVLISATANIFGIPYADNISAGIIGVVIIYSGIRLFFRGMLELIDTGVDETMLEEIKKCIQTVPGVVSIHQLRTRSHGGKVFIDAHILVNPLISVSEGHHIGEKVHEQLLKIFPEVADVIVHIDPENDETSQPNLSLPTRPEITAQLQQYWQDLPGYQQIEKIDIHYCNGQIYLEICWPYNAVPATQWPEMHNIYGKTLPFLPHVASLKLLARV